MLLSRRAVLAGAVASPWVSIGRAAAQGFPARPVTVIVPFAPGGSTDVAARIVSQAIAPGLGVPVVVENRTGAGGVVGWGAVARATPDGYTLLTVEMSFAIAASLIQNLPFDPRAFAHVATAVSVPHVLVVHPGVQATTVEQFVALARARPGELFYGSGGNGTNTHLGAELFKSLTGTQLAHVPYRGAGAVMADLMSGQVQALVTAVPTALAHIRSGRLRALMVTGDSRIAVLPEVPSARESGLPGMSMDFWVGFAAPGGTPAPVVERINREIVAAVRQPEVQARFADLAVSPVGNTAGEASQLVASEIDRWGAIIASAGIRAD